MSADNEEVNAAAVARYRDRVGTRLLTDVDQINTFARFTLAAAENKTPCYGNPDLFFEDHPAMVEKAKAACARCPLQPACLNFALDARMINGVWGGLSEQERARILRARRAQKQKQWKRQREARAAANQCEPLFEMSAS